MYRQKSTVGPNATCLLSNHMCLLGYYLFLFLYMFLNILNRFYRFLFFIFPSRFEISSLTEKKKTKCGCCCIFNYKLGRKDLITLSTIVAINKWISLKLSNIFSHFHH